MSQPNDTASLDDFSPRILRDVGRWATEHASLQQTCRNEDDLGAMPSAKQERLVEELLSLRRAPPALEPLRPIDSTSVFDVDEPSELGEHDAMTTVERPISLGVPAANDGLGWVRVASYGGVAAAAAAITLMLTPAVDRSPEPIAPTHYRAAHLLGTSAPTHLAASDEGYCLDKQAQVRITSDDPMPPVEQIEVVLKATPESGPPHWFLHHPSSTQWSLADDALLFQGQLRDLALLSPGDWTLTFQVGPRGTCGPNAALACTTLDADSIRISELQC